MVNFAREAAESIASRAMERWPHRAAILGDAFAAHRKGRYALSIPVLFAQEMLGVEMFSSTPRTAGPISERLGLIEDWPVWPDFLDAMTEPLRSGSSLAELTWTRDSRRAQGDNRGQLNRHGVLHGIDVDYPTEANSLRAVMLIAYLGMMYDLIPRLPAPTPTTPSV